jgi:hypothetical protein
VTFLAFIATAGIILIETFFFVAVFQKRPRFAKIPDIATSFVRRILTIPAYHLLVASFLQILTPIGCF